MCYQPVETIVLKEGLQPEEQWAYADELIGGGNQTGLLGKVVDIVEKDDVHFVRVEPIYMSSETHFVTGHLTLQPTPELEALLQ